MENASRKEFGRYLVVEKYDNQIRVVTTEDAPKDLIALIIDIHMTICYGSLPNDWIYEVISNAFDELKQDDLELITIEPDVYNKDLYEWFGQPFAHEFCNEVIQEKLTAAEDIYEIIAYAQWCAKQRIYEAVNNFITDESITNTKDRYDQKEDWAIEIKCPNACDHSLATQEIVSEQYRAQLQQQMHVLGLYEIS